MRKKLGEGQMRHFSRACRSHSSVGRGRCCLEDEFSAEETTVGAPLSQRRDD